MSHAYNRVLAARASKAQCSGDCCCLNWALLQTLFDASPTLAVTDITQTNHVRVLQGMVVAAAPFFQVKAVITSQGGHIFYAG